MPYVVVQYKGKIMRTSSAEGSNPTWNEQIVISARFGCYATSNTTI